LRNRISQEIDSNGTRNLSSLDTKFNQKLNADGGEVSSNQSINQLVS